MILHKIFCNAPAQKEEDSKPFLRGLVGSMISTGKIDNALDLMGIPYKHLNKVEYDKLVAYLLELGKNNNTEITITTTIN